MRTVALIKAIAGIAALIWCLSGVTLGLYSYVQNADQAQTSEQRTG